MNNKQINTQLLWKLYVCVCMVGDVCMGWCIYTAGKISMEHVTIFLSKYISKGAIDTTFSPDVGNNPRNPHIQRHPNK